MDRGGLVGSDGPTHHGVLDFAYLRCIQDMVIMAPKDENEMRDMLHTAVEYNGPIAMRYPRGTVYGIPLKQHFDRLAIGKGEILRSGKDVAILAIGNMVYQSIKAAQQLSKEGIEAEVVNMRFVKPIDGALIEEICHRFKYVVTVEDHVISSGFGGAVLECMNQRNINGVQVKVHGLPNDFVEHGTPAELHAMLRLDADGIASVTKEFLQTQNALPTLQNQYR
jgi:1-deoxy-D-xylulose-5-phosphate synthase